jgi:hypothetical protein
VRARKQADIDQWRAEHIHSGEAVDNSNFAPVTGDWRERVRA